MRGRVLLQNFAHAHHESTSVQADLIRWFENCEMRSFVLADEGALPSSHGGAPLHDPLHFPGGAACVLGAQRHK